MERTLTNTCCEVGKHVAYSSTPSTNVRQVAASGPYKATSELAGHKLFTGGGGLGGSGGAGLGGGRLGGSGGGGLGAGGLGLG